MSEWPTVEQQGKDAGVEYHYAHDQAKLWTAIAEERWQRYYRLIRDRLMREAEDYTKANHPPKPEVKP